MKTITIPVLNGDGISNEIMEATKRVVEASVDDSTEIIWVDYYIGKSGIEHYGTPLHDKVVKKLLEHTFAIKGPSDTPEGSGYRSINVQLRNVLGLFACIRPVRFVNETDSNIKNPREVDMVIFRENMEDLYAGIEFQSDDPKSAEILRIAGSNANAVVHNPAVGLKLISVFNTSRLMKKAVEYALKHNRKKITVVAKANIMKFTDGLFNLTCQKTFNELNVSDRLELNFMHIDDVTDRMVRMPSMFDIIVTENVYGDILSSLAGGLIGGVRYCPGVNMSDEFALFEATHGTAPDIAGKGLANPIALVMSAQMMMGHIGEIKAAKAIQKAIKVYFENGAYKHLKNTKQITGFLTHATSIHRSEPVA